LVSFSFEDLFVIGIGLDIIGAYLLGRGLLASSFEIARRATSYTGYSPPLAISQIADKVDGAIGLGTLLVGFVLQAVGYAVLLSRGTGERASLRTAVTPFLLALLSVVAVLGIWRAIRLRLMKREAIQVARMNIFKLPVEVKERPYGRLLVYYGEEFGSELHVGETDEAYAKRVFGVDAIEPGEPQADRYTVVPDTPRR
jgi:hypothetical protein